MKTIHTCNICGFWIPEDETILRDKEQHGKDHNAVGDLTPEWEITQHDDEDFYDRFEYEAEMYQQYRFELRCKTFDTDITYSQWYVYNEKWHQ